ncbi:aromatic ring-hydroxylating dioxygenase subunit alpha [Hoeflea sp. TYP-13]|uniref:aromatic ring-hydroxylating dioxygenase subunit alpha n=1 Tax=Hoeflea sp. TYP-13 TaxID=3230023 RepID=UPI0034C5F032
MTNDAALMTSWLSDPGSPAHGLPASAYTDDAFWQAECDTVLSQNWVCVGFVHELKNAGDAVPVTVAGKPLLLVCNGEGEIAAFHNVCRHRCLTLVDEPKNVGKLIRCPYHAWAYDLNGNLRASPHFGGMKDNRPEGFDPADNGLKPVRIAVWHDWIFVNLQGNAPAFEDYAAPLINRLEGMDFSRVEPVASLDFGEIATNWKFIMENFIEPYHVQFVHSTTTDQPLGDHYTIVDGVCLGSAVDLKREIGTSGSLGVSSRYLTLFPNFILGRYFPDQLGVYLNIPLGAGKTAQRRALYTTEGQTLSDADVEGLKKLWWDVHKEDHEMCERLQLGRASPVADDGGLLSPHWEDSVRAFQELVVRNVAGFQEQ